MCLELIFCVINSGDTVDIGYLEYPLPRIFTTSNFLFGYFSILVNFPYISAISNFYSAEQFSQSLQSFLGFFPSAISTIRMRLSNESHCSFQAFEYHRQNFVRKFVLSFFQHRSGNMFSVSENSI